MTTYKIAAAENQKVLQQDVNSLLVEGYSLSGDLIVTADKDGTPKKWIRELIKNDFEPAMSLSGSYSDAHSVENGDA